MTTFAQFQAEQDALNTIHLNIVKYGMMLCDALQQTAPDGYFFALESSGRKYPASIKAPAKHVRFNVLSIPSREEMFRRANWAGGYLYLR